MCLSPSTDHCSLCERVGNLYNEDWSLVLVFPRNDGHGNALDGHGNALL